MGQQHNELRRGGLSAGLSAAIGDTRGGGLERYGETLTPILNLWGLPEWAWLRREKLCAVGRGVAAGGVGTFAGVAIVNTTADLLVVVDALSTQGSAAGDIIEVLTALDTAVDTELASSQLGFVRDTRIPTATSEAIIRYGAAAAAITGNLLENIVVETANAVVPATVCLPFVLDPGNALVVQTTNDAAIIRVNFGWRERRAFTGELE